MQSKLQIAIDSLVQNRAIESTQKISPWFDIIEVGTPLIKSVGIKAVQ